MANLSELGKLLRIARVNLNMSLRGMAGELGVTPSFLSSIECGKKKVPESLLEKLSRILEDMPEGNLTNLRMIGSISNGNVDLTWHNPKHREMVARLAAMPTDEFFARLEVLEGAMGVKK